MGVILDSSVLIAAERQGQNARQMLSAMVRKTGDTEIALSVITLLELAHGMARADTRERKLKREQFIQLRNDELELALGQSKGIRLPLADLLIGVTALELGYAVATGNLRHFQRISGVTVTQL